jgi:transcriptional repressor NrdR
MNCPDCGNERTRVVDTGTSADGASVRRRRECQRCTFRFTTYERPEWDSLQVKKRDGRIEPFDRAKLRGGIERAVEKRQVPESEVSAIVDEIEAELKDRDARIVSSSLVGELASERLRDLDGVAYLRFVSVYKAFSEPEEFVRELDAVLGDELDDFGHAESSVPPDDTPRSDPPDETPRSDPPDETPRSDPPDDT